MALISSLLDFKNCVQATFEGNEDSLHAFGKTYSTQLKVYLVENNVGVLSDAGCPDGIWHPLDAEGWYTNRGGIYPDSIFLDASSNRVWRVYSLAPASESDILVEKWVGNRRGLDFCWLSRNQMFYWERAEQWRMRGIGVHFADGLTPEVEAANLSLKVWHGAFRYFPDLQDILDRAEKQFAVRSVRWQKVVNGSVAISAEWYSNGKVTVNRGVDVDEVLAAVTELSLRYNDSLGAATKLRDATAAAFEFDFSQEIKLDAFAGTVSMGKGDMKLWLAEIESERDFRRFRGVDLHTWDRVSLDVGTNFAYLTVPGRGCVNAVPRLAVIQGEDNAGKTSIFYDGVEIFA
jgi:hypothetical protein